LLQGVVAYVREHGWWSLQFVEQSRGAGPPPWLAQWEGDGILARIENRQVARAVLATGRPAVDLSAGRLAPSLPWVETDDAAFAHLAADHLMGHGLRQFGYCGDARFAWSGHRARVFEEIVQRAGCPCAKFIFPKSPGNLLRQRAELKQWLCDLPKPAGVFACYDIMGQQVLDACREAGIAVPDEISVIAVDDDELLCELSHPPLSSIIPNARQTGYEAAALLDRLMRGGRMGPLGHLIPPVGVRQRQSTDILATSDLQIARAVRFIQDHACDPINVADVVNAGALSRRVLEKRFLKELNRTPHAEILRVRLDRVRRLLTTTALSLEEIAARAGFEHPEYLSTVFKRETGVSPGRFRKTAKPGQNN
jgi:LacI family transcriptional regulator